jgi:5-methylcytosine-specific restriction endonuclease McrA
MGRERRKGKEFSPTTKLAGYERSGGKCESCGAPLAIGKFHYDHKRAIGLGGDNSLSNLELLCLPCHSDKTHSSDNPTMRKADAQRKAHIGATRQKAKIPSRPKAAPIERDKLPLPPRRGIYE